MKKLMVIVVSSFSICASAAIEWSKFEHEGDELKGVSSYFSYSIGNETMLQQLV